MSDLAGFDVIAQVHKDTVVDSINLFPIANALDGTNVHLLGGPFSTMLSVNLPVPGPVSVSCILEFTLNAVVHQPVARLDVTLRGGTCALGGQTIDHIGGSLSTLVPLAFQLMPGGSHQIVLLLSATSFDCNLDAGTTTKIDGVLGAGKAGSFCNGLAEDLTAFLRSVSIELPVPSFTVVPGVASDNPLKLSAAPTVAWIDEHTLAVFGYYSAAASGGSVSAKKSGDLYQANDEFFYGAPGSLPITSRRTALLLSADAFHRVVACPAIRDQLVRAKVIERERDRLRREIFSNEYAAILKEQSGANFFTYFGQELEREDPSLSIAWLQGGEQAAANERAERARLRAEARLRDDVLRVVDEKAEAALEVWQKSCDAWNATIAAVPPPCGTGSVPVFRQPVDAFSVESRELVVMLRELGIRLETGKMVAHYKVDAFIEDVFGDVYPAVEGDVDIFFEVTDAGAVYPRIDILPPVTGVGATGLVGLLVGYLKGNIAGGWHIAMTFLSLFLEAKLQQAVDGILAASNFALPTSIQPPRFPFAARGRDIQITPNAITLIGLISRLPSYNTFNPALSIDCDAITTRSALPSIPGTLHLPETDWGCPEVTFATERVLWDTQVSLKARPRDLTLPIQVTAWFVELGNFTVNSIGQRHWLVPDPRPRWSGLPMRIESGALKLSGTVNHPDPPLRNIDGGPFPLGHLQTSNDVEVQVTGTDDSGWQIRFRAQDGNFYVRFLLDAIDGDGIPRHAEKMVIVKGDVLQLPSPYFPYKAACDAKYDEYRKLKQVLAPPVLDRVRVLPGQDVTAWTREAREIRTLVSSGDPSALSRLAVAERQYGPDFLQSVGFVDPTPKKAMPPRGRG